jgi:hypothetical protein
MFRALNPLKPQAVRKSLLETSDAWVPLGSVSIALHRQDDVPLRKLARQHSKAGECRRVLSPLIQPLFLSFPRQPAALKLFLFHLLHNANSCQFLPIPANCCSSSGLPLVFLGVMVGMRDLFCDVTHHI